MAEQEVLPPIKPDRPNKGVKQIRLVTIGDIKSEMANIYRDCKKAKMQWADGSRAIYMLRQALKAVEVEMQADVAQRAFEMAGEDGAEELPIFNGINMIPPPKPTKKGKVNGKGKNGNSKTDGSTQ